MTPAARITDRLGLEAGMAYGEAVAEVGREQWVPAATAARDDPVLRLVLFDLLTAVDEQERGLVVVLRLWSPSARLALQLHTRCPAGDLRLPTLTAVFAGASWHERATAEMFGVGFDGHPALVPLLLPDGAGHPLRKDVLLAARLAKRWPGAPEPGQSAAQAAAAPPRRRSLPPGVPGPAGRRP